MLARNAFSHWKLDVPFASLAISAASARTLRSPIAGIGTELLAHREKIEVTRNGSPSERSPVPIGRAHCHCTRAGTSRRNLIVLFEFDDFQTCWLDQSANRSVVRQAWIEPPHLRTEKLPACCARTTRKTLSPVPRSMRMNPQPRAISLFRAENPQTRGLVGGAGGIRETSVSREIFRKENTRRCWDISCRNRLTSSRE